MAVNIKVSVKTQFLENQSNIEEKRFVFSYSISITNNEDNPVKLLSRHWFIQDANKKLEEVVGEGVIGMQPTILPGDTYEYSSGAILDTEIGTMEGTYEMLYADKIIRKAIIPKFTLSVPRVLH